MTAAELKDAPSRAWIDANLRMNDILTVGTHNSYHLAAEPAIMAVIRRWSETAAEGLDYTHPSLTAQLDDGARALELDIFYDPEGGRYARPSGLALIKQDVPKDYVRAMSAPGMKVLHVQDIDFRSTVFTYVQGLKEIRAWSQAHPDHTPILLTMNTSDGKTRTKNGVDGLPFDETAYDALDAEIASVFPAGAVITPDVVRGAHATLREGVLAGGWPLMGDARGKILIAVDEYGRKRDAYRRGRTSLEGCMCFVNSDEDGPDNAFYVLNEYADRSAITERARQGFLVRTRSDAETIEARQNDTRRRDAAFASGAHYVSTDYRQPDLRFSDYQVRLPDDAITLVNPIRARGGLASLRIE